jgi:hypothetical protein
MVFSVNATLKEIRLTNYDEFSHEPTLIEIHDMRYKNNHCAMCLHCRTKYGCEDCKVRLCRTAKSPSQNDKSCFHLWHNLPNLTSCSRRIRSELEMISARKKANKMRAEIAEESEEGEVDAVEDESTHKGEQAMAYGITTHQSD